VLKTIVAVALCALAIPAPRQTAAAVRVGYCARLNALDAAKTAGFDYAELSATEIAQLSDEEFEATVTRLKALGLPTPAGIFSFRRRSISPARTRSRTSRWRT
jgi:hypothetical protein